MIPLLVRFFVWRGFDDSTAYRYARFAFLAIVIGGLLTVVFGVSAVIDSCGQKRAEKRIRTAENAITVQKGLESLLRDRVNQSRADVNRAERTVDDVRRMDANRVNNNANDALRRFRCEVEGNCN